MKLPPDSVAPEATAPGLRERKKLRTRTAISDAAMPIVMERGFDNVTLAEMAAAADVSVKTILNHFGSKEEVVIDEEAEVADRLAATLRAPLRDGRVPLAPLHAMLAEHRSRERGGWQQIHDPVRRRSFEAFLQMIDGSRALRARWSAQPQRWEAAFAETLAERLGRDGDDLRLLASFLAAVVRDVHGQTVQMVRSGVDADTVERRTRALADATVQRVATAFPELVVPPDA